MMVLPISTWQIDIEGDSRQIEVACIPAIASITMLASLKLLLFAYTRFNDTPCTTQ
jgi:hypothetical protein